MHIYVTLQIEKGYSFNKAYLSYGQFFSILQNVVLMCISRTMIACHTTIIIGIVTQEHKTIHAERRKGLLASARK